MFFKTNSWQPLAVNCWRGVAEMSVLDLATRVFFFFFLFLFFVAISLFLEEKCCNSTKKRPCGLLPLYRFGQHKGIHGIGFDDVIRKPLIE